MKTLTVISLLANVAFVGALVWAFQGGRMGSASDKQEQPLSEKGEIPTAAPSAAADAALPHFRWSQLESVDYRTYIANLRGIGCPEQTIRDIITADVHAFYEDRHAAVDRSYRSTGEQDLGMQVEVQQQHARLREKEAAVLLALLGPQNPRNEPAPSEVANSISASTVQMPVVLQEGDLSFLRLNAGQLQAIANLRQEFVTGVGGPNQDPSDPAYRKRWQEMQPEMDDLLKGMLGAEDYQNYQIATRIQAAKNSR